MSIYNSICHILTHNMTLIFMGMFKLMLFLTILFFLGKVVKKMTTFSLLPNFGKYIRNPAKILVILSTCQNFGKVYFDNNLNNPYMFSK